MSAHIRQVLLLLAAPGIAQPQSTGPGTATILERVRAGVASGASLEQVKRARPTKEWDKRFPKSFVTSDHVIEEAYNAATGERTR